MNRTAEWDNDDGFCADVDAPCFTLKRAIADIQEQAKRIKALEEELADYKEGCEGLKLAVGDLRDERDSICRKNALLIQTIESFQQVAHERDVYREAWEAGEAYTCQDYSTYDDMISVGERWQRANAALVALRKEQGKT